MSKITRDHLIKLTGMVGVEVTYLDALLAEAHLEGEVSAKKKSDDEVREIVDNLKVTK